MQNFKFVFIVGVIGFLIWFMLAWPIGFNVCPKENIIQNNCDDNCYSQPNKMEDVEIEMMRNGQLYIIKANELIWSNNE